MATGAILGMSWRKATNPRFFKGVTFYKVWRRGLGPGCRRQKAPHLLEARALSDYLPVPAERPNTSSRLHNTDLFSCGCPSRTKPLQLHLSGTVLVVDSTFSFLLSPSSSHLFFIPLPHHFRSKISTAKSHISILEQFQPISPLEEDGVAGKREQGKTAAEKRGT